MGKVTIISCAETDPVETDSVAAAVHSTIGNVAPGSAFAVLQSAGAGGAGAQVVAGFVQVAGAVAATGGAAALAANFTKKLGSLEG